MCYDPFMNHVNWLIISLESRSKPPEGYFKGLEGYFKNLEGYSEYTKDYSKKQEGISLNLKDTFTCCKKHIYVSQKTYLANVNDMFVNVIVCPHTFLTESTKKSADS